MGVTGNHHADTEDYGGRSFSEAQDKKKVSDVLMEGTVERVIPGSYTVVCSIPDLGAEVRSVYCPGIISNTVGVDECELPQEGSNVLLFKPSKTPFWYIVCILPDVDNGYDQEELKKVKDEGRETTPEINFEPGADYSSIKAYSDVFEDDTCSDHLDTNSGRPFNIMAGEWVKGNKMGVYMAVMYMYSAMAAGNRAKLEMFLLDDLVRLTSGTFEHNNPLGMTRMFDDEGNLIIEASGSNYQHERAGEDDFTEAIKEEEDEESYTEKQVGIKVQDEEKKAKDRWRFFGGALADLFQLYSKNPREGDNQNRSADMRFSVGYDGSISGVSRGGIHFGLRSRIPIPTRIREPWDPDGDVFDKDEEGAVEPEAKTPFQHNADFPYGRNLASLEARAWQERNLLKRFDEAKKDFKVPNYNEITEPPTTTDKYDSETGEKVAVDAGWEITPDGGVRFWDGSGAEIYMRGGVIYMTAPGGIQRHVGKSDVTLAGHDIIQKARNSIDLTTSEKDIRIAAKGTAHVHSIDKATMITSAATSARVDGSGVGEDANNKGVIIGGGETSVVVAGKSVALIAENDIKVKGNNVILSAINRISSAARSLIFEANGSAALQLLGSTCSLLGRSIQLAADSGISFFRRNQVGVIEKWTDIETNPYQQQLGGIVRLHGSYYETDQWLPVSPEAVASVRFTYRTPEQYGTDRPAEVDDNATEFHVYSPAWSLESWKQLTGVNISTEGWTEEEVEKTFPWPGAGVRESALVIYEPGSNVEGGELANRENMIAFGGTFETVSMDEYQVVK